MYRARNRKKIIDFMNSYDLVDVYRTLHKDTIKYSWRRFNSIQRRRVDYFLVSEVLGLDIACWKSNNTNAGLMASALSLALDPTFGIHSHKTLDTVQPCHLLKPN